MTRDYDLQVTVLNGGMPTATTDALNSVPANGVAAVAPNQEHAWTSLRQTETAEDVSMANAIHSACILLVDDEPVNIAILDEILSEAGYSNVQSTTNPYEVCGLYREFQPALVVLDLMMPGLDGLAVLAQLRAEHGPRARVNTLMLTADITPQVKRRALAQGARDFLTKPFDAVELLLRIENLLETHILYKGLECQNLTLEERVQERTADLEAAQQRLAAHASELEEAHLETLECLSRAGEFRDDETGQHTWRVSKTTGLLAQQLGMSDEQVKLIQQAARLHDVGKIGISDTILLKPGKLTDEEFALMRTHTTIGFEVLADGQSDLVRIAQRIAHSHHERWDGNGYPQRLAGEEIPLEARMLAVADVFDALTHDRPYKKAWPTEEAVAEIVKQSGRQFDPLVVEAFLQLPHESLV